MNYRQYKYKIPYVSAHNLIAEMKSPEINCFSQQLKLVLTFTTYLSGSKNTVLLFPHLENITFVKHDLNFSQVLR